MYSSTRRAVCVWGGGERVAVEVARLSAHVLYRGLYGHKVFIDPNGKLLGSISKRHCVLIRANCPNTVSFWDLFATRRR